MNAAAISAPSRNARRLGADNEPVRRVPVSGLPRRRQERGNVVGFVGERDLLPVDLINRVAAEHQYVGQEGLLDRLDAYVDPGELAQDDLVNVAPSAGPRSGRSIR